MCQKCYDQHQDQDTLAYRVDMFQGSQRISTVIGAILRQDLTDK